MLLTLLRHPVRTAGATLRFFFSFRTPILPRLAAVFALAYLVWPVDLIPDVAPLLGWLDDAGFAALAFGWVMNKVGESEAARLAAPDDGALQPRDPSA
jgi:uncharacterized membrane protein YkvA (DUF1232 family)